MTNYARSRGLFGVVVLTGLLVLGCSRGAQSNVRPRTAVELCDRLVKRVAQRGLECSAETGSERLSMLQAVEAAVVRRRGADLAVSGTDKLTDVGWVAYLPAAPKPDSLAGLVQLMGRQLAGVALLEAHNDVARVSVYLTRGELSAADWDEVTRTVTGLTRE